jgi:hypothetical protein
MPGAKPGERRGGRQKGTQNKANAQFQLIAMHETIKAGLFHSALTIADKVSPYYDARLAPLIVEPPAEPEEAKAKRLHDAMRQMRGTIACASEPDDDVALGSFGLPVAIVGDAMRW